MSGDRIEHGKVTDSVVAFGKGAKSSTRTNRAATAGRSRGSSQSRSEAGRNGGGENITGQVVAKGRGSSASGYVDGRLQTARDEREQER